MTAVANPHAGGMLPIVWDYVHPTTGETVRNVEALCRRHLNRLAAGFTPPLEDADYAESLGYMLGEVIVLAEQRYDPARATSLGDFLNARLPGALIDHWRRFYGRNGERRVFDARSLDAAARDAGVDDADPGVHRPDDAVSGGTAGDPGDRAFPREWLEPDGDGGAAGPRTRLGPGPGSADPDGVDRGGAGAGGRDGRPAAGAPRAAAWLDCVSCGWRHYPAAPNGLPGWHYPSSCSACEEPLEQVERQEDTRPDGDRDLHAPAYRSEPA